MNHTDKVALDIFHAVSRNRWNPHQIPWFNIRDKPIADAIQYPEHFRVESLGYDTPAKDFVYVLHDRGKDSQSMIIIKQSKTFPPLAPWGTEVKMLKRGQEIGIEIATLRGIRAVRVTDKPRQFEYIYELHWPDKRVVNVSETKMKLMMEVHLAILKDEQEEKERKCEQSIRDDEESFKMA